MAGSDDIGSRSRTAGEQGSALEQAKSEASRLSQAARGRTLSYIEERKATLADNVGGVADAARNAAQQFDEHGNAVMAEYIHRAADGLKRFSQTMRERDVASLMGEAEDFARRQPAVFIGAGVAVGFLLARFLKSSAERREAVRGRDGDYDYAAGLAAESSIARRAYQEGLASGPGTGQSSLASKQASSGALGARSEGQARREMREGLTGSPGSQSPGGREGRDAAGT